MDPSKGHWELQKTPRMSGICAGEAQHILGSRFRLLWEKMAEVIWLGLFCLVVEACSVQWLSCPLVGLLGGLCGTKLWLDCICGENTSAEEELLLEVLA